jgi:polar amino acid transport system substrate-binding protein
LLGAIVFGEWRSVQARNLADKQWNDLSTRGALRVGIDPGWQPFSFYSQDGWHGLDADVTREIARRLNLQVQTDPVGYDSMYDALHLWQVDMGISALVVDPSRTSEFAYSDSYFDAGLRLVSPQAGVGGIHSIKDLAGKRLAVTLGSDADRTARYWARRLGNVRLVEVAAEKDVITAVTGGSADAAIVEALTAVGLKQQNTGWQVVSIAPQTYAIAVRRDNPRLLAAINEVLTSMRADGTLDAIIARWVREG